MNKDITQGALRTKANNNQIQYKQTTTELFLSEPKSFSRTKKNTTCQERLNRIKEKK